MPQNIFKIYDGRTNFWQWDTGQKLIVLDNSVDEVHFTNTGMSFALTKTVYADSDGLRICDIPDIILQDSKPFLVYAYDRESEYSRTIDSMKYSVRGRPTPEDYNYEEDDRMAELLNGLMAVEHALERGAVIKRFNTLQEAEVWASQSQEIGLLINVCVDEKWIPYVVDSDHSISKVDDDSDIYEEIQQLKQLLGNESVEKQINDAIEELHLPDTYSQKEHKHTAQDIDGLEETINNSHIHENKNELDKIVDGDVEKWNAALEDAKSHSNALNIATNNRIDDLEAEFAEHVDKYNDEIILVNNALDANTQDISDEIDRATDVEKQLSERIQSIESDIKDLPSLSGFATEEFVTVQIEQAIVNAIATDDEILEILMQVDILPVVTDADGSILSDENNNILIW